MFNLPRKKTVSFLVSGRGLLFREMVWKIRSGEIQGARIGVLVTDNPSAGALAIAKRYRIPAKVIDPAEYASVEEYEQTMVDLFQRCKTDLVVAAGFMRLLSPYFVGRYRERIINIHPSLLPAFKGRDAQRRALDYGTRITGCTAHFIDETIDGGPIILQKPVTIDPDDTVQSLSRKIITEEYRALAEAIGLFCQGRVRVEGRKTVINDRPGN